MIQINSNVEPATESGLRTYTHAKGASVSSKGVVKIVKAEYLAKFIKGIPSEPWLHARVLRGALIVYIWDTRDVVLAVNDPVIVNAADYVISELTSPKDNVVPHDDGWPVQDYITAKDYIYISISKGANGSYATYILVDSSNGARLPIAYGPLPETKSKKGLKLAKVLAKPDMMAASLYNETSDEDFDFNNYKLPKQFEVTGGHTRQVGGNRAYKYPSNVQHMISFKTNVTLYNAGYMELAKLLKWGQIPSLQKHSLKVDLNKLS